MPEMITGDDCLPSREEEEEEKEEMNVINSLASRYISYTPPDFPTF